MVRFCFNTTFVSEEVWIVIHTGVTLVSTVRLFEGFSWKSLSFSKF